MPILERHLDLAIEIHESRKRLAKEKSKPKKLKRLIHQRLYWIKPKASDSRHGEWLIARWNDEGDNGYAYFWLVAGQAMYLLSQVKVGPAIVPLKT